MKDDMGVPELLQQIKLVENEVWRVKDTLRKTNSILTGIAALLVVVAAFLLYRFW